MKKFKILFSKVPDIIGPPLALVFFIGLSIYFSWWIGTMGYFGLALILLLILKLIHSLINSYLKFKEDGEKGEYRGAIILYGGLVVLFSSVSFVVADFLNVLNSLNGLDNDEIRILNSAYVNDENLRDYEIVECARKLDTAVYVQEWNEETDDGLFLPTDQNGVPIPGPDVSTFNYGDPGGLFHSLQIVNGDDYEVYGSRTFKEYDEILSTFLALEEPMQSIKSNEGYYLNSLEVCSHWVVFSDYSSIKANWRKIKNYVP